MLSGHSVVTPQGNDPTRNSPRNARLQSSELADRAAKAQKVTLCARADLHLQNKNKYREHTHARTHAHTHTHTRTHACTPHTHTHTHTHTHLHIQRHEDRQLRRRRFCRLRISPTRNVTVNCAWKMMMMRDAGLNVPGCRVDMEQ